MFVHNMLHKVSKIGHAKTTPAAQPTPVKDTDRDYVRARRWLKSRFWGHLLSCGVHLPDLVPLAAGTQPYSRIFFFDLDACYS